MIYYRDYFDKHSCISADRVRSSKGKVYINAALSFDIETSQTDYGADPVGFMYIWQMGISDTAIFGRTWTEFKDCLSMLREALNADRREIIVFYVHNLAFEFAYVAPYLEIDKVFARSAHHPIYFTTRDGFEFRCSYFLTGKKLSLLAENTRYSKLVGDLDYSLCRHHRTELTAQEMAYCANDVLILTDYIQQEIQRNGDITKIPLTKTGYVRREVLQSFREWDEWEEYQKRLRRDYPSEECFGLLYKCFSGGFTHANCDYVGITISDVASVDLASSYPTQMLKHKFPSGKWHKLTDIANRETLDRLCADYGCIMEITFKNIRAKTSHHTISRHKCSIVDNGVIDNGRIVSGDYITTYITSIDYDIIKRFYEFEAVNVHQFYWCKMDYLPKPLIDVIIKRYRQKTLLKGAKTESDKALYALAKEFINSLYGMTVTNPLDDDIIYEGGAWRVERGDVDKQLKRHRYSDRYCLPYAVGVFVTAWARWELLTTVQAIGRDAIYCDTDSIKLRNYHKYKHIIEAYNKRNEAELTSALLSRGYKIDAVKPRGKLIGIFEYEGSYAEFKTLGAKRYCGTVDGKFTYTVAGLPRSPEGTEHTPLAYMLKQAKGKVNNIFNVFDFDMHIPASWACKKEAVYNVNPWCKFVTDYRGETAEVSEQFGVALHDIPFTMSIANEFLLFLAGGFDDAQGGHKYGVFDKPELLKITAID